MTRDHCHMGLVLTQLAVVALAAYMTACGGSAGDAPATPRPVAYPRIEVPDTNYVNTDIGGITVTTNAMATIVPGDAPSGDGTQFNISYGRFGVDIYCTVTPVTDAAVAGDVIANRTERMALNTGANTTEVIDIPVAGGSARVTITPTGSPTPVQFIACRNGYILSGAAYLPACATQRTDTLQPVVSFLRRDIIRLVSTLP